MAKGFYIGLKEIVDVRAGVINSLRPDLYEGIIKNGYHDRKGDFFEGIAHEEYLEKYRSNDVELLINGTLTNVFQFLYPQVADFLTEALACEATANDLPTIDVNTWPYELSSEETAYLRTVVYTKLGGMIGVNMIHVPITELLPSYCSDNYHMMLMYDYHDYLNAHGNDLVKTPRPTLIIVGPMVYFNTDPETNEETIDQLRHGINSLHILEASVAPRIGLKFINVDVFSIIYPDNRILKRVMAPAEEGPHTLDALEKEYARRQAVRDAATGA